MPEIDLRLLRLFDAVYEAGSTTQAAEKLGLSQPTVSIGLKQLRVHYADPLFVQVSGKMRPTPFANGLIASIRAALHQIRQASQHRAHFEPAQSKRRFRIAMSDASHLTLLPTLFDAIRSHAPQAGIDACPIDSTIARRLADGKVDIAIGVISGLDAGFYQRVLYEQGWVTIMRAGHPLTHLTRDGFASAEHVEVTNGTGHDLLRAALVASRISPRIGLSLPGFLGLPSVLGSSDLIATLPHHIGSTLAGQAGLAMAPCPIPVASFQVKLFWHEICNADPENAWLRKTTVDALLHRPSIPPHDAHVLSA